MLSRRATKRRLPPSSHITLSPSLTHSDSPSSCSTPSSPLLVAQSSNNAAASDLVQRLLCFEPPVRELEIALRCGTPLALSCAKLQALSRLRGCAVEVKRVAGKLLRPCGGFVSRIKGLWNATEHQQELDELARNIDSCVADLTLAEVRQQGAAAQQAQLGAAAFHTIIIAQQEDLARQVALLQRAGAAGSGSTALEVVVRELAAELRMQRSDVAKQLEAERFLLNQNLEQLADLEGRVLEAIDAKTLSEVDVARLGAVVGEQLAALDARSGTNAVAVADLVAKAVGTSLAHAGMSAAAVQAAVHQELVVTAQLCCALLTKVGVDDNAHEPYSLTPDLGTRASDRVWRTLSKRTKPSTLRRWRTRTAMRPGTPLPHPRRMPALPHPGSELSQRKAIPVCNPGASPQA